MRTCSSFMKFIHMLLIALFLCGAMSCSRNFDSQASQDDYEDTDEFLKPQVDPNQPKDENQNYRSHYFTLLKKDGTEVLISESTPNIMLKPASTMKLFTGWWAFRKKVRTTTYLSKMLRESVNSMADSTVGQMGGPKAMVTYYTNLGLPTADNFKPADGSGLSYSNQTNCKFEISLLRYIRQHESYQTFKNLLAQPGQAGTLRSRMKSLAGKVFAKTGTLNRTASLTGFLETSQGTVLFCMLSDYIKGTVAAERSYIDSIVLDNFKTVEAMNLPLPMAAN